MNTTCRVWKCGVWALATRRVEVFHKTCWIWKNKERQTCLSDALSRVVPPGIEPGTQGFSVLCSTNWAMAPFRFCECKGKAFSRTLQTFYKKNGRNVLFSCHFPFFSTFIFLLSTFLCTFASVFKTIRDVAQLVAHYVRDVGVGRSSRLIPT